MSFLESPAKKLFKNLARKFSDLSFILRSSRYRRRGLEVGKPGEVIEKLSPEEREILKGLTSEEVQNSSVPFDQYICDEYWEKKSEEERYKEYLKGPKERK